MMGARIRTERTARLCAVALFMALAGTTGRADSTRLKDIVTLQGASASPLVGYGLVVGLNKTGDKRQTIFSAQTLANMLVRFGVSVPAGQIKIDNVAAVLLTTELPPYARPGARLDVTVSSVGDARSL
ncbi:MAG: flagellar basal body P-ring protein FlgI, partial [Acidobacteriota bacterium]